MEAYQNRIPSDGSLLCLFSKESHIQPALVHRRLHSPETGLAPALHSFHFVILVRSACTDQFPQKFDFLNWKKKASSALTPMKEDGRRVVKEKLRKPKSSFHSGDGSLIFLFKSAGTGGIPEYRPESYPAERL